LEFSVTPTITPSGYAMILTIGQTAKAVGLSKTSICKHIASGKLSAAWNNDTNPPQREIDGSEIMRVYGVDMALPPSKRRTVDTKIASVDTPLDMVVKAKDETIAALKAEVDRLAAQIETKDGQIAAANRLLAAPKPDDHYAALLEKMEKLQHDFASQQAEDEAPVETPPAKTELALPNRGLFAWLKTKAA
jgi:uncharacterized small protein (DUF1192 family)